MMGSLVGLPIVVIMLLLIANSLFVWQQCLNPRVGAPHHFLLQGVEEGVVRLLYHANGVCSLAQCEGSVLGVALTDSVDGHKETAATALDTEANSFVVGNDDRAYG